MAQANSGDFLIKDARLCFSDGLWEPTSQGAEGGDLKYGCTLIFPGSARALLEDRVKFVCVEKWGEKALRMLEQGRIKNPVFRTTDPQAYSKTTGERWAGFENDSDIFIRCKNNADKPPRVLWRSRLVDATKADVYSGCYGQAVLNAYSWEHPTGGMGVTFNVRMFQKLKEGPPLGGSAPVDVDKYFVETEDTDVTARKEETVDIFK